MKYFVVLLFLATLGCGKDDGKKSGGETMVTQAGIANTDITNRSSCRGSGSGTIYSKAWMTRYQARNGVILERAVRFQNGSVEVAMTASYGNKTSEVRATAGMRDDGRQIEILSADSREGSIAGRGGDVSFVASLRPMTFKYSFVGPCLKIQSTKSDALVLVPKAY